MLSRLAVEFGPHAQLRIRERETSVWIDPFLPPPAGDITAVTWGEAERLAGLERSLGDGATPQVLASPAIRQWLSQRGALHPTTSPPPRSGLEVVALPYKAAPYLSPQEGLRKLGSLMQSPRLGIARLRRRVELPRSEPEVLFLTFESGVKVLYLSLALHARTPAAWLHDIVARAAGVQVIIAGVDYDEVPHFMRYILHFHPRQLLLIQPHDTLRHQLGLPIQDLRPVARDLNIRGIPTQTLDHGEVWTLT